MRRLGFILLATLAAGCASPGKPDPTLAPSNPPTSTDPSAPVVRLDENLQGRIVSANTQLRFVVMDFPLRRVPQPPQSLNVYREGRKVGEVKVTGPSRDTTTAGDITTGEARVGDDVRED